tara:strand:- start:2234 stop:2554 length:321 start_codon:yes stop_codon:yes gene_type:complete
MAMTDIEKKAKAKERRIERANNEFDEIRESLPEGFHVGYIGNCGYVGKTYIDDRAWAIYREHGEERPYTDKDWIGRARHAERYKLNRYINLIRWAHGEEVYADADS